MPDDLRGGVAEDPLGGRVERLDGPLLVDGDDAIHGGVDDRPDPVPLLSSSSSIHFSFSEVTSAVRCGTAASGLAGAGLRAVFDRFADLFAAIATYPLHSGGNANFPIYRSGTGEDMGESSANSTRICRI